MPLQQAPWKLLLAQHLSTMKMPTCGLATIAAHPQPTNPTFSPHPAPPPPQTPALSPRCRTIVHRGFLATLPENPLNPLIAHNPPGVYESDLFTFTTDARMTKTGELQPDHKSGGDATVGTGGGGEVEQCFWVEATQNQWRVRGRCYLLAEEDADSTPDVTDTLQARLRPTGKAGVESWSWKKEVQAHFGNMAPAMRGGFANPPPSTPLDVDLGKLGEKSGGAGKLRKGLSVSNEDVLKADGLEALARRNFRVGVVVPEVVERVDLAADGKRSQRWVWWWVGEGVEGEGVEAGWKGVETFP